MQTQPENLTKLSFENYSTHFGFAKNLSSLSERRTIFPFVADELKFVVLIILWTTKFNGFNRFDPFANTALSHCRITFTPIRS
jgi:pterin-4a-carbinolamine dehydratase